MTSRPSRPRWRPASGFCRPRFASCADSLRRRRRRMASTSSPRSAPSGSQRPRVLRVPEYVDSAGDEAIELAGLAGLELDDWQRFVLRHSLGERPDGKWAAKAVGLVVGRQNGKGSVLEARELAGLFLLGERTLIHTAHLQKTATNHFERVLQLIESVPEFDQRVLAAPRGKGSEAIKLRGGQRIFFMTRARGNTRGLTVDLMVFDEAMYLSETERNAMVPTMAAQSISGNTQSWYVGSAVDQEDSSQDGVPFAQVRESGHAGADGVAFFEWSAPGDDPSNVPESVARDPEMWAMANPGLGIRISHEWVEHERTVEMGARGFNVERLGIGDWPDTSEDAGRVIARAAWSDAAEHDAANRIAGAPVFAIDSNMDQTWGSVGVAGKRADGLAQFEVDAHERGIDWIVEHCLLRKRQHSGATFVILKNGPAASLIEPLKAARVKLVEANTEDYARACAGFVSLVVDGRGKYPAPQPELDEALSAARRRTRGDEDSWTWSR